MLSALYNNFCLVQLVTAVVALLLAVKVYIKLTTGWCNSQTTLQGKVAIVTGANTGKINQFKLFTYKLMDMLQELDMRLPRI